MHKTSGGGGIILKNDEGEFVAAVAYRFNDFFFLRCKQRHLR